jgi:sugar phosphate isomerase/epimerase
MQIEFYCPRWGCEDMSWDSFCSKVKAAGYDGIESSVPFEVEEKKKLTAALQQYGLKLIGQYHQSFEKDFATHKNNYERYLLHLAAMQPVLIDAQTGKDYFTAEQNQQLFKSAKIIAANTGVMIAHETHRNKALFAAHVAYDLLKADTEINITADFSHWCNVAESLLEDQEDAVAVACERAVHIHARVGFAEGPQVNDPRAPEWQAELQAHLRWWDAIVKNRKQQQKQLLTITPEFGPVPYMHTIPYTKETVASQWDINVHMMQILKQRYVGK